MANTQYNGPNVKGVQPALTEGVSRNTIHLHNTVAVPATLATTDTVAFGWIPPNAIVTGAGLKAQTQLDSNGAPTLAFNLGVVGTPALFKSAVITVGRVAGASFDSNTSMAAAGYLYKNVSGLKQLVIASPSTVALTGVAGNLECMIAYHVEEAVGSPA